MNWQLKNKRAFISGSTQGIGYAIATSLLEEGVSKPHHDLAALPQSRDEVSTQVEMQCVDLESFFPFHDSEGIS